MEYCVVHKKKKLNDNIVFTYKMAFGDVVHMHIELTGCEI